MTETKSTDHLNPGTMSKESLNMRQSMRARMATATFLAMVVLVSPPIFLFTSGIGAREVYVLTTVTAFAILAALWCLRPLVDRVFPPVEEVKQGGESGRG